MATQGLDAHSNKHDATQAWLLKGLDACLRNTNEHADYNAVCQICMSISKKRNGANRITRPWLTSHKVNEAATGGSKRPRFNGGGEDARACRRISILQRRPSEALGNT